jgi:hypothetical protein
VKQPRTDDAEWSPVVEVEMTGVDGARALQVIHRLWYEPGCEHVMGHLLVPLASGLFEFRLFGNSQMTGIRETTLAHGIIASAGGDPVQALRGVRQSFYDDARHDATFPAHPLSRVRAGLRSLRDSGAVTVTTPAPVAGGEVIAETESFAVTAPPRYLPLPTANADRIQCSRISFAGTDGVQLLTVHRVRDTEIGFGDTGESLLRFGKKLAAASVPPDSTKLHVEGAVLPDRSGRPHARVYRSFDSPDGPQHTEMRWFVDEAGAAVMIAAGTSSCVPVSELAGETAQVAASYRIKGDPGGRPRTATSSPPASRARPWWKL